MGQQSANPQRIILLRVHCEALGCPKAALGLSFPGERGGIRRELQISLVMEQGGGRKGRGFKRF